MYAVHAQLYKPENTDYCLIALFTTEENAHNFVLKLKEKFPDDFEVSEWHQPIIDPKEVNEVFPS
jgi:hypothetical protein